MKEIIKKAMPRLRSRMRTVLLWIAAFAALSVSGCQKTPETVESVWRKTGDHLASVSISERASAGNEWVFLGLSLSGRIQEAERESYLESVDALVRSKGSNRLNENKSTENSRTILGILAAGGDPTDVGGQDLVEGLKDIDYVCQQGHNGPIWALIAVGEMVGSFREALIQCVLDAQQEDGGFSMMNGASDTDLTAMAIQALAPYEDQAAVKECIDRALTHLSKRQKEDGTFEGYGARTSESISQVILALCTLGIQPESDERFIKNGITLVDALLSFRIGDGFKHVIKEESENALATEQAYLALTALVKMREGKRFRYVK